MPTGVAPTHPPTHWCAGAKEAFGAALAANPTDAAAANNAALALQYSNHLSDAVAALEHAFQAHPAAMMQVRGAGLGWTWEGLWVGCTARYLWVATQC